MLQQIFDLVKQEKDKDVDMPKTKAKKLKREMTVEAKEKLLMRFKKGKEAKEAQRQQAINDAPTTSKKADIVINKKVENIEAQIEKEIVKEKPNEDKMEMLLAKINALEDKMSTYAKPDPEPETLKLEPKKSDEPNQNTKPSPAPLKNKINDVLRDYIGLAKW